MIVEHTPPGWALAWGEMELEDAAAAAARARHEATALAAAAEPVAAALRRLFRAAGTAPTRYRPSPEALFRRLALRRLFATGDGTQPHSGAVDSGAPP